MRTTADVLTDLEHTAATEATVIEAFKEDHRKRVAQLQSELEEIKRRVVFTKTLKPTEGSWWGELRIGDTTHTKWAQRETELDRWRDELVKAAFPAPAELVEALPVVPEPVPVLEPEPVPEPVTPVVEVIEPTDVTAEARPFVTEPVSAVPAVPASPDETPTPTPVLRTPAAAFDPPRQQPQVPPFEVPFNERDTPLPVVVPNPPGRPPSKAKPARKAR